MKKVQGILQINIDKQKPKVDNYKFSCDISYIFMWLCAEVQGDTKKTDGF